MMNFTCKVVLSGLYLFISLLMLSPGMPVFAQEPPLKSTGYFDRSEIILVWDEGNSQYGARINERNLKLKFNYQGFDQGERLTGGEKVVGDTVQSYDRRQFDVISGDFNDDQMADYLYSYTADGDSLHLVLANRSMELSYTSRKLYRFNGRILEGKNLIDGDLDGDGLGEFVVGFRTFDNNLARLAIMGFDENFNIEYYNALENLPAGDNFVVDLCDVDGDGDDELVVGYEDDNNPVEFILEVYDFDGGFNPAAATELSLDLPFNANDFGAAALTGLDYNMDGKEELVLALTKNELDQPNNPDTYLFTAEVTDDTGTAAEDPLEMIEFFGDKGITGRFNYGLNWQILLKSGDLNNDGNREIVLGCYGGAEIFNVYSDHQLEYLDRQNEVLGYAEYLPAVNYFDVADMTGDDRADIVAVNHYFNNGPDGVQGFNVTIVQFDSLLNSSRTEWETQFEEISNGGGGGNQETHFAVSLSDFDGDLFRIGEYTSMGCFTDVVRPITVLNTPPVHIDMVAGVIHDVNECYGDNDCLSSVQKSVVEYNEESYSFQQESTGDWGFDPQFTAGVDFNELGTGVRMSPVEISSLFGGDVEELVTDKTTTEIGKTTSISKFQTESMDKRFSRDDALLTMVNDYERWEYPVYNQYEEMLGEIVILIPRTINQENWLRGREVLEVSGLIQLHEQGNLLSYRKFYDTPEELMEVNPDIREVIAIANEHELDLSSSYTESITWGKEFENQSVSVENVVETWPSGGVSILGTEIGVQDESVAEETTIRSHTIKVGQNLGIEVFGSQLAGNSYEYKVRPYYYWSKHGALVVDYMVDLSGGSFWQDNYGQQDPGFVFPNRLDSLKAKNEIDRITDLDLYTMTPSIMMDPAIPVNGDSVTVTTIVHNLSLSPTSEPVEVSFYLGDPDRGGSLISDISGNTVFTTGQVIGDQHYAIVSFKWLADFERFDRMYAVVDPHHKLEEGKEDNNKAWAPVQRYAACGETIGTSLSPALPVTFEDRFGIYPNPGKDLINLDYNGPYFQNASVVIYDLSGKVWQQELINFVSESNQYNLRTQDLEPGMYILSITTDHYFQRTKLMIE
jgi:hypothetical protein